MANLVFVTPPYHGHLGPMLTLARTLSGRGHSVTFATTVDGAERVTAAGLAADVVGRSTHPPGSLAAEEAALARVRGLVGLAPVVRAMAETTGMLARELPAVVRERRAEAIVHDQLEPAGALVARATGLLQVSVANALPINRGSTVPPFFTGWPPATKYWERERIAGAHRIAERMMSPLGDVLTRQAARLGLESIRSTAGLLSPTLDVAQMAPELEYPGLGGQRLDVGPIREQPLRPCVQGPSRALVFTSLGTLFGGRLDIFQAVARATERLGMDVVVAHGGRLSSREVATLPHHVRALAWVDQAETLAKARLAITHAGMNTVLDAMASGVPMVAIPLAFDQPGIAARLAAAGLGKVVRPGPLLARRLKRAITEVIEDGRYGERSRRVAASMAHRDGAADATGAIERLIAARSGAVAL